MVSAAAQIVGGIAGLLLMWLAADRRRIRQHRMAAAPIAATRGA